MSGNEAPNFPEILLNGISLAVLISSLVLWILWGYRRLRQAPDFSGMPLRPWAIGWVNFGIFMCGLVCLVILVQTIVSLLFGFVFTADMDEAWGMALGALTLQSSFLLSYYACRRYFPTLFRGNLSTRSLHAIQAFFTALSFLIRTLPIIGLVAFLWNYLLEWLIKLGWIDSFTPQEAVLVFTSDQSPLALVILALFAVIVAPLAEEVIFRGCIYRFLKSKLRPHAAMFLSASLFGFIHGNLMAFIPLAFVGFLLAYTYEKERNLLVPIFYHGLFNLFTLSVTILHHLSGNELPY
ncbi:MAG: hypothetical protein CNE95_05220 [Puniceicoccaceae bacterium MED-G30]|jgi:membrane protease YdiL (CAAX protease family)|nr:MAG: hypothetical protein CNE95_05220 [Puniceicoccaceae bacterium MED-G30]RPG85369.1 MAG: CPBP family intramembrane metalloprotease [Coraliomargarita sp. TMED73]|tara:strand:+ start:7070 stop:7954 length:885 start_codon:yes stop_codon:yes gene_type:complete